MSCNAIATATAKCSDLLGQFSLSQVSTLLVEYFKAQGLNYSLSLGKDTFIIYLDKFSVYFQGQGSEVRVQAQSWTGIVPEAKAQEIQAFLSLAAGMAFQAKVAQGLQALGQVESVITAPNGAQVFTMNI